MRRKIVVLVLLTVIAGWPIGVALAHGPIRRGLEIDHKTTLNLQTGEQSAEWRWVTVGLVPGTVHVTATLKKCGNAVAPSCGLYVFLYRRHQIVARNVAACFARSKCNQTVRLTYRAPARDVYYVLVSGAGANGIPYRLTVSGSIVALHCQKYC